MPSAHTSANPQTQGVAAIKSAFILASDLRRAPGGRRDYSDRQEDGQVALQPCASPLVRSRAPCRRPFA